MVLFDLCFFTYLVELEDGVMSVGFVFSVDDIFVVFFWYDIKCYEFWIGDEVECDQIGVGFFKC